MCDVQDTVDEMNKLQAHLIGQRPLEMSALAEASLTAHSPERLPGLPATQILSAPGTPRLANPARSSVEFAEVKDQMKSEEEQLMKRSVEELQALCATPRLEPLEGAAWCPCVAQ